MAKVTHKQVEDEGFHATQFGTPPDWQASGGYVARLIAEAAAWVEARVGETAYAVTTGLLGHAVAQAELCKVRAMLWRRRSAFLDANAQTALTEGAPALQRSYLEHARQAEACAEDWIATAIAGAANVAGSGATLAYVESGPYAGAVTP